MTRLRLLRLAPAVVLSACFAFSGCGGSMSERLLVSMTISPANAVAHNSVNGQVTFTATGNFSQPPSPATVPFANWSVDNVNIATINPPSGETAVAQSLPGQSGTVTVFAKATTNDVQPPAARPTTAAVASATLTCP